MTNDMQLEILRDADGAIIGFSIKPISPDESVNDDIINIVQSLHDGRGGYVKVGNSKIILGSPNVNLAFEVKECEASIIGKYLDGIVTDETRSKIEAERKWIVQACFLFENEQVRQESLVAQTKS